ncbi:MAG: Glu-tRNA(Gln) amidotransferase subunit GatE [Nitrososphaerales archaeon]
MSLDPNKIGLKVGLEIHQQLLSKGKLFCECSRDTEDYYHYEFLRRLRPTQSELGEVDPAASFEFKKGVWIKYKAGKKTSCLVEADEEPPHDLNREALESCLIIALALKSKIVDEIHVMRKIVIDGSNTTGFQRTALVALGGEFYFKGNKISIQTITLEEDSGRLLGEMEGNREYGLERLGIPLIEISLAPLTLSPKEIEEVALYLGRLMRATGRVARGLGTIRQDLNISIADGNVVEVKGIQKLELLSKVLDYEMKRQYGLMLVKEELVKRGVKEEDLLDNWVDVTKIFAETEMALIKKALSRGERVLGLKLKNFKGILGFEPFPDIRLGKEIAEMVRFYGLKGIFHSDEILKYGIKDKELKELSELLDLRDEDGFILIAGELEKLGPAMKAIVDRCRFALKGGPSETRGPTEDGKTKYSRPRPGAARMYPETDIPLVKVDELWLEKLRKSIPPTWEEQINKLVTTYGLSRQLAVNLYDSDYFNLFERAVLESKAPPSFIASTLAETMVRLLREGYDVSKIDKNQIVKLFTFVGEKKISKEACEDILKALSEGKAKEVLEAQKLLGVEPISEEKLREIIARVVESNRDIIKGKGERAFGHLMGIVMKEVRGKVDGKKVSILLREFMNS